MHPAIPLIAGFAGSALQTGTNVHLMNRMNRFNAREAEKSRAFSREMRGTHWQATVEDMTRAGINPALAYQSGANSAPGAGTASGGAATAGDPVASAIALKTQSEQLKVIRSQRNLIDQQAIKAGEDAQEVRNRNRMESARLGMYFERDSNGYYKMTPAAMELIRSGHEGRIASNSRQAAELRLARLREPEMKAIAQLFQQAGASGVGIQRMLPLIISLLRGR